MMTSATAGSGRREAARPEANWTIEGLRCVAALLVVAAHYGSGLGNERGLSGYGFTGVDLFFVLSGFVFAPYFFGRPLAPLPHYSRRLFRIYPLYLAALAFYAGLKAWQGLPLQYLASHVLLLQTLHDTQTAFYYNPAFWSLPPEMEFYLFLPLLVRAATSPRRRWMLGLLALFVHLVVAWTLPDQPQSGIPLVLSAHLPGRGVEFALGILSWCLAHHPWTAGARLGILAGAMLAWWGLGALWVVLGETGVWASPLLRGNVSLDAALCFAAMVAVCAQGWQTPPTGLRQLAFWGGNLSYGTYLFHNAMPPLLQHLLPSLQGVLLYGCSLVATLMLALGLHRILEAPARRYGRHLGERLAAR